MEIFEKVRIVIVSKNPSKVLYGSESDFENLDALQLPFGRNSGALNSYLLRNMCPSRDRIGFQVESVS